MPQLHVADRFTEARRRDVFRLLVVGQDCGMSVAESLEMVCRRFRLEVGEARCIQQEGIEAHWPPL
jgi:hypothetical protein